MDPRHEPSTPRAVPSADKVRDPFVPISQGANLWLYLLSFFFLVTMVWAFVRHNLRQAYRDTLAYWDIRMSDSDVERVSYAALWLKERRTDTVGVARNPLTIHLLTAVANGSDVLRTHQSAERVIETMAHENGFLGGVVADTSCRIVAKVGVPAEALGGFSDSCQRAQYSRDLRLFVFGVETTHLWLFLAYPVFPEGEISPPRRDTRRELGVVMMVAEPWKSLFPYLTTGGELHDSTETLIVWPEGKETVIFSPRLAIQGVESIFRRPLSERTLESLTAREDNVEFGEFTDYRGVRVLGAARYLKLADASVIRKVDRDVALAEFRRRSVLEWSAGSLFILLLGCIIAIQHRQVATRHLKEKLRQHQTLLDLKQHVEVSEGRFRAIFQGAAEGIVASGFQTQQLLYVNPAACRMLGYQEEELTRMRVADLHCPEDLQNVESGYMAQIHGGNTSAPAVPCRCKDGTTIYADIKASRLEIDGKDCCVAFFTDVTARKRAEEELRRSLEQLRALAAHLQSVREEERKRLAREIHDQLGQALTAMKLDLSSLVRDFPDAQYTLLNKASPIFQFIDETIDSVHRISTELRPGMLDDLGLAATVEWATEEFATRTGTKCLLDLSSDQITVGPETATAVFRIFQETLTNVARHAKASEVKVRLAEDDGDLTLEVRDNGMGIGENELGSADSLGILGMRERALLLGGTLVIRGEAGKGTTVSLRIPKLHRSS